MKIEKENVKKLYDGKFIKLFDLQYAPGKHYFEASRRNEDDLAAVKTDEEFKKMIPDAVSCIIIVRSDENEAPKLLMSREFRYPAGRFLLSPPAGLIDESDKCAKDPLIETAKREIFEETGVKITDKDHLFTVCPLTFSSPGMTDESNALVCAIIDKNDLKDLSHENITGTELFGDFYLMDREEARKTLKRGTDSFGNAFSLYTWAVLMYFVSGLWEEEK